MKGFPFDVVVSSHCLPTGRFTLLDGRLRALSDVATGSLVAGNQRVTGLKEAADLEAEDE